VYVCLVDTADSLSHPSRYLSNSYAAANQALLLAPPYTVHDAVLTAMRAHVAVMAVQQAGCWAIANLSTNRACLIHTDRNKQRERVCVCVCCVGARRIGRHTTLTHTQ
jgi:hypothetical protein